MTDHMGENEYNRQLTKLSNGNRNVLSSPWEEAGKLDQQNSLVASTATGALMGVFNDLEELRRIITLSSSILDEYHVGEMDPLSADEYRAEQEEAQLYGTARSNTATTGMESGSAATTPRMSELPAATMASGRPTTAGSTASRPKSGKQQPPAGASPRSHRPTSAATATSVASVASGMTRGTTATASRPAPSSKIALHLLWLQQLNVIYDQSTTVVESLKEGFDRMIALHSGSMRSLEPLKILRAARHKVEEELKVSIQGPQEDEWQYSPTQHHPPSPRSTVDYHSAPHAPRVPLGKRPASSIPSLSARVAAVISTAPAKSTQSLQGQLLEQAALSPRQKQLQQRPHTSGAQRTTTSAVSSLPSPSAYSPRAGSKEQTRVQVIKRTTEQAKELLRKLDVRTVVPCAAAVSREVLNANPASNVLAEKSVEAPSKPSSARATASASRTPRNRQEVPNVDATAAEYAATQLPHDPETTEEKAAAILGLKADKATYRTLSVEERQIVVDHERAEQLFHHKHAIINMKIVGANVEYRRLEEKLAKIREEQRTASAPRNTKEANEMDNRLMDALRAEERSKTKVHDLQRQKKSLEDERQRNVRLSCIALARNKRHLPQIYR